MNDYLSFGLGVIAAGLGGEAFVRGSVGLARSLRVSPAIIGATVAAFGTSSPELSVGISSSLAGAPQVSFGDAMGSNILNVAVILGIALLIGGICNPRGNLRNMIAALLIPLITIGLTLDGTLSRGDGIVLLLLFLTWFADVTFEARRQRRAAVVPESEKGWRALLYSAAGLALLAVAGYLIVRGATGIAVSLGLGTFFIGAVIVAAATSVPELATTITSKLRGHDEIGLNTILGSNIFNGLLIVGTVAVISPARVARPDAFTTLGFGFASVVALIPSRGGSIPRWRGFILLALYAAYVVLTAAEA